MAGATVILVDGALAAYLARGEGALRVFLPDSEPDRGRTAREVVAALADMGTSARPGMLLSEIDGHPAGAHPLAAELERAGFTRRGGGLLVVRRPAGREQAAAMPGRGEPADEA